MNVLLEKPLQQEWECVFAIMLAQFLSACQLRSFPDLLGVSASRPTSHKDSSRFDLATPQPGCPLQPD